MLFHSFNEGAERTVHRMPITCPACDSRMAVTELACPECSTRVQGVFEGPGLYRLTREQLQFVEVFLRNRGNIREVERDLKISYPTVRSRLDQVIEAMGYPVTNRPESNTAVEEALDALHRGEMSFEEALNIIQERKASE